MLAARLASAASLNPPKQRRQGKAGPSGGTASKPRSDASARAKPKAMTKAAKTTPPARHVWLAARTAAPPRQMAEVVRLVPKAAPAAGLSRAA